MAVETLSPWTAPETVQGFAESAPNRTLLEYASRLRMRDARFNVLDIGCGAGRNAAPLALSGAYVAGIDLSRPMLMAAAARPSGGRLQLALAAMDALPIRDRAYDLIVAHGIWNLAHSGREFRRAVREAARSAAPRARLFVFTFSRRTLGPAAEPVTGETFVYTHFSGHPKVFLTEAQLLTELRDAGFLPDPELPLRELNSRRPGQVHLSGPPVIYEGGFRFTGA